MGRRRRLVHAESRRTRRRAGPTAARSSRSGARRSDTGPQSEDHTCSTTGDPRSRVRASDPPATACLSGRACAGRRARHRPPRRRSPAPARGRRSSRAFDNALPRALTVEGFSASCSGGADGCWPVAGFSAVGRAGLPPPSSPPDDRRERDHDQGDAHGDRRAAHQIGVSLGHGLVCQVRGGPRHGSRSPKIPERSPGRAGRRPHAWSRPVGIFRVPPGAILRQPRSARGLFFVYPGPTGPPEIWHAEKFESR